jgi:hypothetical protein
LNLKETREPSPSSRLRERRYIVRPSVRASLNHSKHRVTRACRVDARVEQSVDCGEHMLVG